MSIPKAKGRRKKRKIEVGDFDILRVVRKREFLHVARLTPINRPHATVTHHLISIAPRVSRTTDYPLTINCHSSTIVIVVRLPADYDVPRSSARTQIQTPL
ncbi:unnamed protein product, partial [Citrullus colocynthis]